MNVTKKKFAVFFGSAVSFLAVLLLVFGGFSFTYANEAPVGDLGGNPAGSLGIPCPPGQLCNPLKAPTISEFLSAVLDVVVQIGTVVVVFFIIYSGFLFVRAQGNPEQLSKAKNAFLGTILGAALVLGAWVLSEGIAETIEQIRR